MNFDLRRALADRSLYGHRRTRVQSKRPSGIREMVGVACLASSLLLTSFGVRAVRAEGEVAPLMTVDPALAPAATVTLAAPPAMPLAEPAAQPASADPDDARTSQSREIPKAGEGARPGQPAVEIAPGIVVLNTRGYNYGPPPGELDRQAIEHERRSRTTPASP